MSISCFSRTIPAYKRIEDRVRQFFGLEIDSKDISKAVYAYAAEKGLDETADSFNPKYEEELNEFIDNYFLINRHLAFEDKDVQDVYTQWFLANVERGNHIDVTSYTDEEIQDIKDITLGEAKIVEARNKKYALLPAPMQTVIQSESPTKAVSSPEVKSVVKTFEEQVSGVKSVLKELNKRVIRDPDFAKNHKYTVVGPDGKKHQADVSVTGIQDGFDGKERGDSKPTVRTAVGNVFDDCVRQFFKKGRIGKVKNLHPAQRDMVVQALQNTKAFFDKQFPEGYEVITDEELLQVGGFISNGSKTLTVAGTMDMLIIAKKGDDYEIYIIDAKAMNNPSEQQLVKYTDQVNFYKKLLGANDAEIAEHIAGIGLLTAQTKYGAENDSDDYELDKDGYIMHKTKSEGETILETPSGDNEISTTLNTKLCKNDGGIYFLPSSDYIESQNFDFEGLTPEEKEAMGDDGSEEAGEGVQSATEETQEQQSTFVEDERYKGLSDCIPIVDGACPMGERELVFLGKALIRNISMVADELASGEMDPAELFVAGDKRAEGYNKDSFLGKRSTMLTPEVFGIIKDYVVRRDFLDYQDSIPESDPMYDKIEYVVKHSSALLNAAFAELLDLEKLSLYSVGEIVQKDAPETLVEMYELAEAVAEEREAYFIDSRTVSYVDSLSSEFKRAFSKIIDYQYDENGNIIMEDGMPLYATDEWGWGFAKFISRNQVITTMYRLLHGLGDVNQMMRELEDQRAVYPWLQQVIDILNTNPDLKNMLFTAMRKSICNYKKTYTQEKYDRARRRVVTKYVSIPLSNSNKVNALIDQINVAVNTDKLFLFSKVKKKGAYNMVVVDVDELNGVRAKYKELAGMTAKNSTVSQRIKTLTSILADLGISGLDNMGILKSSFGMEVFDTIVDDIKTLIDAIDGAERTFSFSATLGNPYYGLANDLSILMTDQYQLSVYDLGKSRTTFSEPTYIETLVERLAGRATIPYLDGEELPTKEQLYEKMWAEKYDAYWQFSYVPSGGSSERVYYNPLLTRLRDKTKGKDARKVLQHYINTSTDDTEYQKQSVGQLSLGILLDYAAPSLQTEGKNKWYTGQKNVALYRVGIMSDKNADERIRWYKYSANLKNPSGNYGLDKMHKKIAQDAFGFVELEVHRIKNLFRGVGEDSSNSVDSYSLPKTDRNKLISADIDVDFNKKKHKITRADLVSGNVMTASIEHTGAQFEFIEMLNDEIVGNTEYGQRLIDFINGDESAAKYLKDNLVDVMEARLSQEVQSLKKTLQDGGMYEILQDSIDDLEDDETTDAFLDEFIWNDFLMACCMYNLTVVDLAFHKDPTDVQKRFAEVHASTQKPNLLATFVDENGVTRNVTDGRMRYVVVDDVFEPTTIAKEIKSILTRAAEKAPNAARQNELIHLADAIPEKLESINLTDGQAFGGPTAFWKKLKLLGRNNPEFDEALKEIRAGHINFRNYTICIQAIKSFTFSQRDQVLGGEDTLVPTQLKDSEAMLLLAGAILTGMGSDSTLANMYRIMEESAYDKDGNYNGTGIDLIVFKSAVKTGATKVIPAKVFKNYNELKKLLYKRGKYTDYVQSVSFEDWGLQQETPNHLADHRQGMPSQGRVLSVADLDPKGTYTVNGVSYSYDQFLKHYFELHQKVFEVGIRMLERKLFLRDADFKGNAKQRKQNRLERNRAISKLLLDSIVQDSKYSVELRKAFTLVNGEFILPIGDPSLGDKFFGAILSTIKKAVNDELMPGGPTVIRSCVGVSKSLKFFKDTDGGLTAEVYASFPSSEIEDLCIYNSKKKAHQNATFSREYSDGDIISVEDALANGFVTEDDIRGIADRIPTENKYSQIRYRIKEFMPRFGGEYFIFPKEKTALGGDDFDIDKIYPRRKYNLSKWEKKIEKGDISLEELDEYRQAQLLNEIFDMQWTALGHPSSQDKMVKPGEFEVFKDIAKEMYPNRSKERKPLVYFSSHLEYFRNNAMGKQFVGIGALNNVGHALCSMAKVGFTDIPSFTINGVESRRAMYDSQTNEYTFDSVYSPFDGSLISDVICKFVGASADNAKEAILGALNASPTTANAMLGLIRMGVPLRIAVYMMNLPAVKAITDYCYDNNIRLEGKLLEMLNPNVEETVEALKPIKEALLAAGGASYESIGDNGFTEKLLLDSIHAGMPEDGPSDVDIATIQLLADLVPHFQAIRSITERCSLNSTKNAAHKSGYDALQRRIKADVYGTNLIDGNEVLGESAKNILQTIPFLGTLSSVNTELIPKIFSAFSPLFMPDFYAEDGGGVINKFLAAGYSPEQLDESELRKILNAWLVYKATIGLIPSSQEARKKRLYDYPIQFAVQQAKLSDNAFVQSITGDNMSSKYPIFSLMFDATRFDREIGDDLSASFAELSRNPEAYNFINDYLDYMINRFGFTYSPNSSMSITPNIIKLVYKNANHKDPYKKLMETSIKDGSREKHANNFLLQYALNNPKCALWFPVSRKSVKIVKVGGVDTVTLSDTMKQDYDRSGNIGIRVGNTIYLPIDSNRSENNTFYNVPTLGIPNQFLEYDANTNAEDMETVVTRENNNEQGGLLSSAATFLEGEERPISTEDGRDATAPSKGSAGPEFNFESSPATNAPSWMKIAKKQSFAKLCNELGIDVSEFREEGVDNDVLGQKIISVYEEAKEAGIATSKGKYKTIMQEIEKNIC